MAIIDHYALRKLADRPDLSDLLRKLADIDEQAARLFHEHRLFGWRIEWVPGMGCLGYCIPTWDTDESGVILMNCDPDKLQYLHSVLLHEIAHALTLNESESHGPLWKEKYAQLMQLHDKKPRVHSGDITGLLNLDNAG